MGKGTRVSRFDRGFPFPRPKLPLIIFGCEFRSKDETHEIGVCRCCGLEGRSGDTMTCKLAETWALGKGHFRYAAQGDDHF